MPTNMQKSQIVATHGSDGRSLTDEESTTLLNGPIAVVRQDVKKALAKIEPAYVSKASANAERSKSQPARYDRKFARSQWRKNFGDGTFRYRGKLPSCPSFQGFVAGVIK